MSKEKESSDVFQLVQWPGQTGTAAKHTEIALRASTQSSTPRDTETARLTRDLPRLQKFEVGRCLLAASLLLLAARAVMI
jgi:hypothetical protein